MSRPLGEAATKAALLTLTGLSVAVAFRVGLFNIGARGQLVVGALGAAFIGAHLELPSAVHVTRALVAAELGLGAARLRNRDRWSREQQGSVGSGT